MKVTQEEVVDRQTVLHIELEDEDLDTYLDRGYRRVASQTVVPGFRKGKAPRRIVESYLGRESLLGEVLDTMLPEVTSRAIDEQELDAVGLPRLEFLGMEPFTFKATVPLTPEIDLASYRDIRIAREPVEFSEEDVEQSLERMQQSVASWEPVDRPVAMGDLVTVNATGSVGDQAVLNEQDSVLFLDEDGVRPFPGFAQELVGLAGGEPRDFTLTIPEDHADQTIAGAEAHFSVTVGEIKERILPELDDEFAKSFGDGYESMDALRQQVEEDVKAEAEGRAERQQRDAVVEALLEGATINLPPLMVDHEIEHMEDQQEQLLSRVNVRKDDYLRSIGKTADELREELREEAVKRLEQVFVLRRVGEAEGLEVTEEEVQERIESSKSESEDGPQTDGDPADLGDSVQRAMLMDKTLDRLLSIASGEAPPLPVAEDEAASEPAGEAPLEVADDDGEATDESPETEAVHEGPTTAQPEPENDKPKEGGDSDDQ